MGAVALVTQYVHLIDANRKRELLSHLVKKNDWEQVLVFTKTKHGANRLASQLQKDRINADAIHGNKSQNARIKALEDFKQGKVKVLVATDIAARGLDIEDLPHVVNFDLPHVPEDYVHRIGRTGRAGATGEALSLVCAEDRPLLGAIEKLINRKIEIRDVEGFEAGRTPRREEGAKHEEPSRRAKPPRPAGDERPRERTRGGRGRGGESRREQREQRAPRQAGGSAPRTSGDSGGMDFSKPYEPSPTAAPKAEPVQQRRSKQAIPALFRKKAA
jgi:ATP-dependent RNA helicase RhlE